MFPLEYNNSSQDQLAKSLSSIVKGIGKIFGQRGFQKHMESLLNSYTHAGMTGQTKEELDYTDLLNDDNATVAYERQRQLLQDFGPDWQIRQTAAGFDEVGMNRMLMAGQSPGAAASTAPQASAPSAGSGSGIDVIGTLISSALRSHQLDLTESLESRKLDIEQYNAETERLSAASEISKRDEEIEGLKIQNRNLQEMLDLSKGESRVKIKKLAEECKTEPVRRALLRVERDVQSAREGLIMNQALWQRAQNEYGDRYWNAIVRGAELQNQLLATHNKFEETLLLQQLALNTSQLSLMALDKQLNQKNLDYFDSNVKWDRTLRSVQAGAQALQAIGSTVIGFTGMGMAGKMAGALRPSSAVYSPPSARVNVNRSNINGINYWEE